MVVLKARARLFVLTGAAIVVALLVVSRGPGAPPALVAVVEPALRGATQSAEPAGTPRVDLDRLAQRGAKAQAGDLFDSRAWRAPAPKALPPPAPVPQEEPLPPVPYTYRGRWSEPKGVVVMLEREGRNQVVRVGDVLDAAYRVDTIEPTRIVLTYLPRDATQVIAIAPPAGAANASVVAAPRGGSAADADAVVLLVVPDKAGVGDEITVRASLDPRKVAFIERASVELRYDTAVLNLIRATGSGASGADPGHVALELGGAFTGHGGPTTSVRLRVVGAGKGTTQITLTDLAATDGESRSLAVAVDGSNPRPLTIVGAQR